jgi:hypothetical protein
MQVLQLQTMAWRDQNVTTGMMQFSFAEEASACLISSFGRRHVTVGKSTFFTLTFSHWHPKLRQHVYHTY